MVKTIDIDPETVLGDPEAVHEVLKTSLADAEVEYFCAIPLDGEYRALGTAVVIAKGDRSRVTDIVPSVAFRYAIEARANRIVFAHNHPSGTLRPSKDDLLLTHRLQAAGQLLGIRVVDHVIVARNGCYGILMAAATDNERCSDPLVLPQDSADRISERSMVWGFLFLFLLPAILTVIMDHIEGPHMRGACKGTELSSPDPVPITRKLDVRAESLSPASLSKEDRERCVRLLSQRPAD